MRVASVAVGNDVKQDGSQDRPVWYCACQWPPARVLAISHGPLCPTIQTIVFQIHYPLIYAAISQLGFKNIMGDDVKCLAKVEINDTYCSPLIHKSSYFIIKGKKVGEA